MRVLPILIFLTALWGCKQAPTAESQQAPKAKHWYFWSVDWHPKEDRLVVGGSNDTYLGLFAAHPLQQLKKYPYKGTITNTQWHPSQHKVALSVQDGKSNSAILNLDTGERIELDSISIEGARAIGWNHTGELLAVGDNNGFLTLFDQTGKFLKQIDTNQKGIMGLDWHPDQNLVVAVGDYISLYQYEGDSLTHIEDRSEAVLMLCVDWHPDGAFFVTGDYGDFIDHHPPLLQYWRYDGHRIKAIAESQAEYRNISWSSDGELLATASEKIRLWNKEGELVAQDTAQNLLWGLDWNADASKIVATDDNRTIILWDRTLNRLADGQY